MRWKWDHEGRVFDNQIYYCFTAKDAENARRVADELNWLTARCYLYGSVFSSFEEIEADSLKLHKEVGDWVRLMLEDRLPGESLERFRVRHWKRWSGWQT